MSVYKHNVHVHSHLSWCQVHTTSVILRIVSSSLFHGFHSPHAGEDNIRWLTDCVGQMAI